MTASLNSIYYPYEKVQTGYNSMDKAAEIPRIICRYLMDLPDANGYAPVDDNSRPRVRLAKYLWYDCQNPLGQPLPTPQEKLSMLFDGKQPDINTDVQKSEHPQGYRIYPLSYWGQSQNEAQAILKCYIGRVVPQTPFKTNIGVTFDIMVNVNYETTMGVGTLSRGYAIETSIISALNGVNITGVGTVVFDRIAHGDSGSYMICDDVGVNIGRRLNMSICWMESQDTELP